MGSFANQPNDDLVVVWIDKPLYLCGTSDPPPGLHRWNERNPRPWFRSRAAGACTSYCPSVQDSQICASSIDYLERADFTDFKPVPGKERGLIAGYI